MIHKDDGNLHALAQYEAQQDKLEVTRRELEAAQVKALIAGLTGSDGLHLTAESLSEHAAKDYAALRDFLRNSVHGCDSLEDAYHQIDGEALGHLVLALIWPYLTDYAERNAEDYLPSVDGPERED